MSQFAAAFGAQAVRESMDRQLVPGAVVYLSMQFPEGERNKYMVMVGADGDDLFFVVNSDINEFIRKREDLLRCQVSVDAAAHPFLQHDSHIACHQLHRLPRDQVLSELCRDVARLKGAISEEVREQVIAAVKSAVTIDLRMQQIVIAALE